MTGPSYKVLPFPRAAAAIRDQIVGLLPGGGKMPLAKFCSLRPQLGRELVMGYGEALAPHAEAMLGEPVVMALPIGVVRHNSAAQTDMHPWHTDAWFFKEAGGRGVTFWLTFDDVGETAPGLEFETAGQSEVPRVPAGTALMFGSEVRHRTQTVGGARVSIEFRCAPASARTGSWLDVIQASVEANEDGRFVVLSRLGRRIDALRLQSHPLAHPPAHPPAYPPAVQARSPGSPVEFATPPGPQPDARSGQSASGTPARSR